MKTPASVALVGNADRSEVAEHVLELAEFVADFIWEVNPKGEYTFVGGAVEEMPGYRPEELLGRHYLDIIAPEQRHIVGRAAAEAFENLQEVHNLRNELVARDGRRVVVLTNGEPILSEDGRLAGYRGADRDVTSLFTKENELRRFKSAIDGSNFGVAIASPKGELTYVNAAFARDHGYTPQELIGRHLSVLHTEGQMPTVEKLIARLRGSGRMEPVEVEHMRRDGTTFPMLMVGSMVRDDDGHPVGMTVSASDISAQKQASKNLAAALDHALESDRLKSACLSTLSHEIRTPLNHIIGFADLISHTSTEPQTKAYAERISASGDDFLALVTDLIQLTLADQSEIKPRQEPFALSAFFDGLGRNCGAMLAQSGKGQLLSLNMEPDPTPGHDLRLGDQRKIGQILFNLYRNALKFTPADKEGKITIGYHQRPGDGDIVRFTVRDTGPGIPEEKHSMLFRPFRQGEEGSMCREHRGLGIGLAMSSKIAAILGATLHFEPVDGGGACFVLDVPLPPAPPHSLPPS